MVTALILNERPKAELWLVAPTKQVAAIAFTQASGIIALDDDLRAMFHVQDTDQAITHRTTGAILAVKAADLKVVTGCKAAYVLVDELHELASLSKAAEIMIELKGGLAARPDGFFLTITTQSKHVPAGVFRAELAKARAVRDGKISLPLLPVLYELPAELTDDDGWQDPRLWGLVNPALGAAVQESFLSAALVSAKEAGKDALALLASQHFNVQPGTATGATIWPGAQFWDGCGDPELTLDELKRRSEVCVVGVDGGGLDDLFGLAVIGREKGSRKWLHWAKGWAFPEVLEQRKDIAPRLQDFIATGELTLCEYVGQEVAEALEIIGELDAAGLLPDKSPAVGLDVHGIADLIDGLEDELGFDADRFVSVGQGYKLQSAVITLPRRLKDRGMLHGASPLMSWNVGNAKTELRGSNYLVTKSVAGSAKIDLLIATFNAAMLMLGNPAARRKAAHKVFFV